MIKFNIENEGILFVGYLPDGRQVWYRGIRYFGQPCILMCDGKCDKAWGSSQRKQAYNIDGEYVITDGYDLPDDCNEDDYCYLADGELGEAPDYPQTWEGGDGKPIEFQDRLNKWCCRECERSETFGYDEGIEVRDLSQRFYNCFPHVRVGSDSLRG
jgi:hypothetical protein